MDTVPVQIAWRMLSMFLIFCASIVLSAGCFEKPTETCSFACGRAAPTCPRGFYCASDQWCKAEGTLESYDCGAALLDATPADIDSAPADASVDASADASLGMGR